jgi:hypothetical protein
MPPLLSVGVAEQSDTLRPDNKRENEYPLYMYGSRLLDMEHSDGCGHC